MSVFDDADDGTRFRVEWRVFKFTNRALAPYYTVSIEMFAHTFEDGERALLACPEFLRNLDEGDREMIRANADGTPLDENHPHVEAVEVIA